MSIATKLHALIDFLFKKKEAEDPLAWSSPVDTRSSQPQLSPRPVISSTPPVLPTTFREWKNFFHSINLENEQSQALSKMIELATTNKEKVEIYNLAEDGSSEREIILRNFTSEEKSYDEWFAIFREAETGSGLERLSGDKAAEKADDMTMLAELLVIDEFVEYFDLNSKAVAKLKSITASFKEWKDLSENYDGEIKDIAIEKMIETSSNYQEFIDTVEAVDDEEDAKEKFLEKVKSSEVLTESDCRSILNDYDNDYLLYSVALDRILSLSLSTEQCLRIYFDWEFSDEDDEKILKKIFSLATPSECAIIALVAEDGTTLKEWAEERVPS